MQGEYRGGIANEDSKIKKAVTVRDGESCSNCKTVEPAQEERDYIGCSGGNSYASNSSLAFQFGHFIGQAIQQTGKFFLILG